MENTSIKQIDILRHNTFSVFEDENEISTMDSERTTNNIKKLSLKVLLFLKKYAIIYATSGGGIAQLVRALP